MTQVSVTKSYGDLLIMIITALVAGLTAFMNADAIISVPVIVSCVIAFLDALLDFNKKQVSPTPTPAPTQ